MLQHKCQAFRITKLFSDVSEILNYDGLWENNKFWDENQRFDWIKLIH